MFNNMRKQYSRLEKVIEPDGYNQDVPHYKVAEDVTMFISLITKDDYNQNDLRIKQASHIGITFDDISIGDIIADHFEATYVNKMGRDNLVYLKEMESNGIFC